MGAKIWTGGMTAVRLSWDFSVHGGAVGTIALGNLPEGFVITETYASATTAPVGGGTMVLGQDGGGDADGYYTDLDAIAVATPIRGTGALVLAASGLELMNKVASATDGVLMTIASTAYTAGKIDFIFVGFQA